MFDKLNIFPDIISLYFHRERYIETIIKLEDQCTIIFVLIIQVLLIYLISSIYQHIYYEFCKNVFIILYAGYGLFVDWTSIPTSMSIVHVLEIVTAINRTLVNQIEYVVLIISYNNSNQPQWSEREGGGVTVENQISDKVYI